MLVPAALVGFCILLAAGCASHPPPKHELHPEPAQPPLAGQAEYFGGAILAEARVTSFRSVLGVPGPMGEEGGKGGRNGPPPGGGGGGGFSMGGGGGGGGMGGPPPGGGGMGGPPPGQGNSSSDSSGPGRGMGGGMGSMPRQMIHLTFTNRSPYETTISVVELKSMIGNFVPQPASLTIASGASAKLDPVSGDAGGVLEWIDVVVSVRRDDRTEQQTLHLVPTGEPAESEMPPPPPPGGK